MSKFILLSLFICAIVLVTSGAILDDSEECMKMSQELSRQPISNILKINKTLELSTESLLLITRNDRDGFGRGLHEPHLPLPTQVLDKLFGQRLFNTTMNYIVPLFQVMLPLHTDSGSTVHLAMQGFLGLFAAIAWISTVAIPVMLTELVPFVIRKKSLLDSDFKSFAEYSLPSPKKFKRLFSKEISDKIGLNWETCFCKTICQAHQSPTKYGLFSMPFLILFPPSAVRNNKDNSQRQQAALDGFNKNINCNESYKCFFDVLDLCQYMMYVHKSKQ